MDNYHITKDGDKWKFKKEGNDRASLTADTKSDIIQQMRNYMDDKTGSVKIHRADNVIQEERTYPRAADPKRSKG